MKFIEPIMNKLKTLKINEFSLLHSCSTTNLKALGNSQSNGISDEDMNEILKVFMNQLNEHVFPVDLQFIFRTCILSVIKIYVPIKLKCLFEYFQFKIMK